MFWVIVLIALAFVALTVVQIARMAWRFLRGDEDLESGDSFGWQLFGGRKDKNR
jgi:hypothetical protein